MKQMNKYRLYGAALTIIVSAALYSCKQENVHNYHNVMDKIEAESEHFESVILSSQRFNENIKTVKVSDDGIEFLIPERKSQLTSFNCTECHTASITELKRDNFDKKAAHWNIKLNHANEETMNCATCHIPNDMDNLQSLTNVVIDLNESYKQCSQCHQEQYTDWKGGAHGKQIGGWAPPRLSNTCVNCHNPHAPQIEKRWPSRYNTQKVIERQ